jgi:general secretion pathway protein G
MKTQIPTTTTRRRRQSAFTLVEMLLVLVILAVLAAIVIPKMAGRGQQAKTTAAGVDLRTYETALDTYELDNGSYPNSLDALVNQPGNSPGWHGPYIKEVKNDPWGNPYQYTYPSRSNPSGFDLVSGGPDGRVGNDDDITLTSNKKR